MMLGSFLTNKHIIASMIIAPILAIMAWFAVDYVVSEVPHKLEEGSIYVMLAKPNCRWGSGVCNLVNNDIKMQLQLDNTTLTMKSSVAVNNAKIALVENQDSYSEAMDMHSVNGLTFNADLGVIPDNKYLQLAVNINNNIFYAVVPTIWTSLEEMPYAK